MRKFILPILILFFAFTQNNQAQIVLKIANVEVNPGTPTATLDVTVDGFTNLVAAQFSINYDSLVIGVNSVTNLNGTLGLVASPGVNFGFPGNGNIKKGQLTFSWSDQNLSPKTLPNGTRLFSIVFNVLGGAGAMSDVTQTNMPLKIEYVNANFETVNNFTSQKGSVKVKGGGGGGGNVDPCPDLPCNNPNHLAFAGDTIISKPGATIKMPIRIRNFSNIQGGQGTFSWDTTKLKFISVRNLGISGTLFQTPPDGVNGLIKYSFFNNDPSVPITLPNNTVIFEIEFEVLGAIGDTTRVCIGKIAPPEMDWAAEINGNIVSVPFCVKGGTVIIRNVSPAPKVRIKINTVTGNKGTTACLDVRVENFTNIRNMQFSINFNSSVLKYVSTGMYDMKNLTNNSFNSMSNSLIFTWNTGDNSVISLADNHRIFQICFELIGDCNTSSDVMITNNPRVIEINGIFDNQNDFSFDSEITNGLINITCGGASVCTVTGTTNTSCFGAANGGATATVTPATGLTNCMCVWKNSQGAIVKSSANLSDCNLANVAAGSYTLELICSNNVECSSTTNIGQPDNINIPATGITNVSCSGKGSVNVTGITGGTQPYTPSWNPNLGNTFTITNLDPGTYQLTITDLRGCTGTQSFVVTDTRTDLTATATGNPVKCFGGNDGSITVTPSGGCPPYTITGNVTNLTAGNYSITVTDASTPAKTVTVSANVSQPNAALAVVSTTVDSDFGQNNGSITLVITGGTPNYQINWQSTATQITQNANPATNLRPGLYNVTVTDANGCVISAAGIEVKEKSDEAKVLVFNTVGVASNFNGFGVDCNGNCNGRITGTVASGSVPARLIIKNGAIVVRELNITATGNFEFTQLCAGTYTIEGVNIAGTVTTQTITITTPTRLTAATPVIQCTEGENNDGSITVNVNNTGVSPYSYQWSNPVSTSNVLQNVGVGTYGVTITDANNCRVILNNLDVRPCGITPDECGVGSKLLTPDGNQQNDVFIITCAEQLNGALAIYDRWGRLVYNKSPYDNSFIGIDNNNNILNEGGYVWIYEVNYGNGVKEVFSGTLTILK
jgi:hypothetical protein